MELYFGSFKRNGSEPSENNLVTFAIPDIGVRFKAPYPAEDLTLDYASLLALLEFVEINPQLFANRALELYCNNYDLVSQINKRTVDKAEIFPYLDKTLEYQKKLKFSINWVARPDNPAQRSEID
jgi:hypothetical protein